MNDIMSERRACPRVNILLQADLFDRDELAFCGKAYLKDVSLNGASMEAIQIMDLEQKIYLPLPRKAKGSFWVKAVIARREHLSHGFRYGIKFDGKGDSFRLIMRQVIENLLPEFSLN